uniref:Succinate--CoA ligase [ADP-forming] subunit beta n=1 Tax=Fervidicoccus fontis TaxID=683846 RepID=A0A7J3ZJQ7_9CREN
MLLQEYHSKRVLARYGIDIPRGILALSPSEVERAARELGGSVVLKSQILISGRGKAGAIKVANSPEEAAEISKELFGRTFKSHLVRKIYVEERLEIDREMYVGIMLDRSKAALSLITSSEGGMDVEEIAARHPEKIKILTIDPLYGLWDYQARIAAYNLNLPRELITRATAIIKSLYRIVIDFESTMAEINPLVLTKDGRLVAADARIDVDDNALFRHPEVRELREFTEADELEKEAAKQDLSYVKLDGNIGVIANGAGMAMATMDLIYVMGGRPANFLDVGGGASSQVVRRAIEHILKDRSVKAIFINIFGGITRCDEVARGIVEALSQLNANVPIVIRLTGTNEEEGRRVLEEFVKTRNASIYLASTMEEGARLAVELSR